MLILIMCKINSQKKNNRLRAFYKIGFYTQNVCARGHNAFGNLRPKQPMRHGLCQIDIMTRRKP